VGDGLTVRTRTAATDTAVSWREYRRRFAGLPAPAGLDGTWDARYLGPAVVRRGAPAVMALTALRGWEGKRFGSDGVGINRCRRGGQPVERLRMRVRTAPSARDGRPAAVVTYEPGQSPLWGRVVDEARELQPGVVLMLSRVELPILRRLTVPVLLERR
jgi:hypothetical protein